MADDALLLLWLQISHIHRKVHLSLMTEKGNIHGSIKEESCLIKAKQLLVFSFIDSKLVQVQQLTILGSYNDMESTPNPSTTKAHAVYK